MITIDHVTRTYDQKLAVDDLSLDIPTGELFRVPRSQRGREKPPRSRCSWACCARQKDSSPSTVLTSPNSRLKPARSQAMCPTNRMCMKKLTGREFLAFLAEVYQLPRDEVDDRIEAEIKTVRVDQFCGPIFGRLFSWHEAAARLRGRVITAAAGADRRRTDGGTRPAQHSPGQGSAPRPSRCRRDSFL